MADDARAVGAVLFAAGGPVTTDDLEARIPGAAVAGALARLATLAPQLGLSLRSTAAGHELTTDAALARFVAPVSEEDTRRIGPAVLEVLTAIAHLQPCTRGEVAALRGVEVAATTLEQLRGHGWIERRGRRDGPGRPTLWGTTRGFLADFGLASLDDLPERD